MSETPATESHLSRIETNGEDVTEGVQALYDLLTSSMDFGSGFLSEDELIPVFRLAVVAGFDTSLLETYLTDRAVGQRVDLWTGQNPEPPRPRSTPYYWEEPAYKEWTARRTAVREDYKAEEIAALRAAYGLSHSSKD